MWRRRGCRAANGRRLSVWKSRQQSAALASLCVRGNVSERNGEREREIKRESARARMGGREGRTCARTSCVPAFAWAARKEWGGGGGEGRGGVGVDGKGGRERPERSQEEGAGRGGVGGGRGKGKGGSCTSRKESKTRQKSMILGCSCSAHNDASWFPSTRTRAHVIPCVATHKQTRPKPQP